MEFQRAAPREGREKWYRIVKAKADLKAEWRRNTNPGLLPTCHLLAASLVSWLPIVRPVVHLLQITARCQD
jgi:hypothetical protein